MSSSTDVGPGGATVGGGETEALIADPETRWQTGISARPSYVRATALEPVIELKPQYARTQRYLLDDVLRRGRIGAGVAVAQVLAIKCDRPVVLRHAGGGIISRVAGLIEQLAGREGG